MIRLCVSGSEPQLLRATAVFIAIALSSACAARPDREAPADLSVVRDQLDSMWSGLSRAMTNGDTAKVGAYYSDSAYFAETGGPTLRGTSSIQSATAGVLACCRYLESRVPEVTDLLGNQAFQFGTYRDVIQPSGKAPRAFYGRFAALLERDRSSAWRIARVVVIRDSSVTISATTR